MTTGPHAALVEQLTAWLADTDIELLELRTSTESIQLHRDGIGITRGPAPCGPTIATAAELGVTAPSLGVFLHRHPLRDRALARPGQPVRAGDPVGLLRIGALLLPVPAPVDGVLLDVLVEDGKTVGFGAVLARLQPS
jgi:acetyl-CoA carboxylase biotin carboxyl carrier protein